MGKLDVKILRYLTREDFRVLTAIEMGMKNHELVPMALITQIANLHHGGLHKILKELCKHRLLSYETTKHYQGYRLTNTGYDYLALKTLTARGLIDGFGNQIGVGKESNIYVVLKQDEATYCLKLHRLGRICFRSVKTKRNYHQHRKYMSWLYLSRISATKEFAYMKVLYDRGFPVPKPIDFNRHCIIMELVDGIPLCNVHELDNVESLYDELMNIICRLARHGVIHGDFNEFNIMITTEQKPVIIDFPQMIPVNDEDAQMYFDRDVNCIREFFRRRFAYESTMYPEFEDVIDESNEDSNSSKVLLHTPTISDDEDECNGDNDNDANNTKKEEDINIDKEYILEKMNQLGFDDKTDVTTEDIEYNLKNFPKEISSSNENSESENDDEKEETSTVIHNINSQSVPFDARSVASTIIPETEIKKKLRSQLLKRDKRIQNKRNLKKSTLTSKIRRENREIARENMGLWTD